MEGDDDPVARDVRVGLEIPVAERDGGREGGHLVLGRLLGPAAVGKGDRAVVLEEGMGHRGSVLSRVDIARNY